MKAESRKTGILIGCIIGLLVGYALLFMKYNNTKDQLQDYQADELEIYPCPFCGSEAVELKEMCGWYVRCEDCGGMGPSHNTDRGIWDENTKAEAVEWWNHNARE